MKIFLTGGTGLIGSHVAERLRARGDAVVALVRESSDTRHLASLGCTLVVGDVLDPVDDLAGRMRGCDAVIHGAAKVFQSGRRKAFHRVNVEGTERVLSAASRVAPRVVHMSSVAVYAGLPMERLTEDRWTEADPSRQGAYASSKHLSERAAWSIHGRGGIRLTTVRPSVVYGERDRAATPIFVRLAKRRFVPLVNGGGTTVPVVYAGNVARGIVAALDRPESEGRAYNLARDVPVSARELVTLLGDRLGRRPRIVPVPYGLVSGITWGLESVTRLIPFMGVWNIHRTARSLAVDNPYDSALARLELGWTGLVSHAEGIRRTVSELLGQGIP